MSENFRTLLIVWIFKVLNHFYFQMNEKWPYFYYLTNMHLDSKSSSSYKVQCLLYQTSQNPNSYDWNIEGDTQPVALAAPLITWNLNLRSNVNHTLGMGCHLRKICFHIEPWQTFSSCSSCVAWLSVHGALKSFTENYISKGNLPNHNFWLLDILHYFLEMGDYCNIYLWRKVVCFVVMRSTKLGCFRLCSWCLWGALDREGCMALVPWRLDLWCKSSWILKIFFTEN